MDPLTQPHSPNVVAQHLSVSTEDSERLMGQRGCVLWFTGLSGSGKSTLANALDAELHQRGIKTVVLDGDNVRHGLCGDLGFSAEDRHENLRRVAEVAKLMADAGLVVLTAFVSPFRSDRDRARAVVGPERFAEIYVDCPLDVCAAR
ncbi:MAG: adenylyl-sulfate kinase, partial [Schleiferiaceae bacterium]